MNSLIKLLSAVIVLILLMLSGVSGNTEEIQGFDNPLELNSIYLSVMNPEVLEIPVDEPEILTDENDVAADGLADELSVVESEPENLSGLELESELFIEEPADLDSVFVSSYYSEEMTLSEIAHILNSILFCILLCISCGIVFLICKIVYPLFRGGR